MKFEIINIHKKYNKLTVLNGFNYEFESGLYLLTGINGIGKSTLLKIIAKVINPTNINYSIDNKKVAYLCEKVELVNSNVVAFLNNIKKLNGVKTDVTKILNDWKVPNKNIGDLSKGNKQKVALIMMRLTKADIYLFDEPTDALDQEGINLFTNIINELLSENKIVVISTHEKSYFNKIDYKEVNLKCGQL